MNMRLELVPLPTSDVDRSEEFYVERLGFILDHDVQPGNGMRVVQMTPPGSACSIVVGVGISVASVVAGVGIGVGAIEGVGSGVGASV